MKPFNAKKALSYAILGLAVPVIVVLGATLFRRKSYAWISLCVAVLSCIPLFLSFERKQSTSKKLVLIAVMIALSVVGRILFTPLPGFKPVTAFVIITAMYLGSEAGFITGAMTAVISNFYFGQGPWTPFQMFVWGFLGLLAGLIARPLREHKLILAVYGAVAGVLFSALMDVWTVLWADGTFRLSRYLTVTATSLPFAGIYAVSNVIFLLLLAHPIGKVLERIKIKYGV